VPALQLRGQKSLPRHTADDAAQALIWDVSERERPSTPAPRDAAL